MNTRMLDSADIRTVDAKVLVVGGGFAGCWAALRAAELTDGVVLVEKAYASRSGASPVSGGVTQCPGPGEDLSAWMKELVEASDYTCNQHWLEKLWRIQEERVKDYKRWGVPMVRDEHGNLRYFPTRGGNLIKCIQYSPRHAMRALREELLDRGCTILDRILITGLVTSDGCLPTHGRVTGAVGFHTREGTPILFRAGTVILATGYNMGRGTGPIDMCTRDGVIFALDAGARVANPAIRCGGTLVRVNKSYHASYFNVAIAHGVKLVNALGERFLERYDPERLERTQQNWMVACIVREILSGRGPIYMDLRDHFDDYAESLRQIHKEMDPLQAYDPRYSPDPRKEPILVEPDWSLRTDATIWVDLECRTDVEGLLAVGGSADRAALGGVTSSGIPTAWANVSGYVAGEIAAASAAEPDANGNYTEMAQELLSESLQPLWRTGGTTPADLENEFLEVQGHPAWAVLFTDEKLRAAQSRFEAVIDHIDSGGWARDAHQLVRIHELKRLAQNYLIGCQGVFFRTESRGGMNREEYPYTDNQNWRCNVLVKRTSDGLVWGKEPVCQDDFPFQPPAGYFDRRDRLSPVVAIMHEQRPE